MRTMLKSLAVASALVFAGLSMPPAIAQEKGSYPGELTVTDTAEAFTPEGIKAAEDAFAAVKFKSTTMMTVETFRKVPDNKRSAFEAAKADRASKSKFFGDWARELATNRKARGVFVLVSMEGGVVQAINDRQTDVQRSFDDKDLRQVELLLNKGFVDAGKESDPIASKKARDTGLLGAVEYVSKELKNTSAKETTSGSKAFSSDSPKGETFLSKYGGYICIGLVGLMVAWVVIGIIRALTGGGGGGYGGGGYGGGYGGGGGGFFSGLMGGMFGAMAGMYLYNNFLGGGATDTMASDSTGGDMADTGAGDFDGGGDGGGTDAGGDYSGGDYGGGDYSGGDYGGGDFGGGDAGGDFGGGDW